MPNGDAIYIVAVLSLLLAFLSSSQDVVIDAYRTDTLRPQERGIGSTAVQIGWRVAFYVSGALAMVLSGVIGWRATYLCMAAVMGATTLLTLLAPEPEVAVTPPRTLQEAVIEPIREFFSRPGVVSILLLVVLYKLGDAAALDRKSTRLNSSHT